MPRLPLATRSLTRSLTMIAVAAGGLLLTGEVAIAQSGRHMMIIDNGDGAEYFTAPDMHTLRRPDFERDDLPLFKKKLALDTAQHATVETLLNEYLETFHELMAASLPKGPRMVRFGNHVDGAFGDHGDIGDMTFDFAGDLHFGDLDVEGNGPVAITVTAIGDGGVWAGADGAMNEDVDVMIGEDGGAHVMIAVATPDGVELSEEDLAQLEEHAKEMAERLESQMAEMEETGEMPMLVGMPNIEDRRAHYEELNAIAEEFAAAKAVLRAEFIGGVQEELQESQIERWPGLDRALTRKKTLPTGRLDGERTDLIAIAEKLNLDEDGNAALAEQLAAYDVTLDDALTRRNAVLKDTEPRISEALKKRDPKKAISLVDRVTQLRVGVRTVNDQFANAIAATLDDETATTFRARVDAASYPRVYRTTPGTRIFEAARQLEGLDEDTLMTILELEGPYRGQLEAMNAEIVRAIRKHQPDEPKAAIEHMRSAMENDGALFMHSEDDPVSKAYDKRRQLEKGYVKSLHDVLTAEQVALLPELPKRRRGPYVIQRSSSPAQ